MSEREPMPEPEAIARPIFPDERTADLLYPDITRVVGFVRVDISAKQLREGTVIGLEGSKVTVRFDTDLPSYARAPIRGKVVPERNVRTFSVSDTLLLRRVDYNLIRKDPTLAEEWVSRGRTLDPKDRRYMRDKLTGPGIERVKAPMRHGNGVTRSSSSGYRGLPDTASSD